MRHAFTAAWLLAALASAPSNADTLRIPGDPLGAKAMATVLLGTLATAARCGEPAPIVAGAQTVVALLASGKVDIVEFQELLMRAREAVAADTPDGTACWQARGIVDRLLDQGPLTQIPVIQAIVDQVYEAGSIHGFGIACELQRERLLAFRSLTLSVLGRRIAASAERLHLTGIFDRQSGTMSDAPAARVACGQAVEIALGTLETRLRLRGDRLKAEFPGFQPGVWSIR